jgi:hypothetical protein
MKKIALSVLLVSLMGAAQAEMYVEANLGSVTAKVGDSSSPSRGTFGLGLGYKVNPNFAVVGKYQDLYSEPGITSSAFSVRAVGIVPVSNAVSLNGKLGVGSTKVEISGYGSKTSAVNYGFGADFALNKQMSLGLDVDFYPVKVFSADLEQTNVSLVAKYSF